MKKGFIYLISRWFLPKKTACILSDDTEQLKDGKKIIEESGISVDSYSNYNTFLFDLHLQKNSHYAVAFICRNGSTTKSESVSRFIKQCDPLTKTIIFTNVLDLKSKLLAF